MSVFSYQPATALVCCGSAWLPLFFLCLDNESKPFWSELVLLVGIVHLLNLVEEIFFQQKGASRAKESSVEIWNSPLCASLSLFHLQKSSLYLRIVWRREEMILKRFVIAVLLHILKTQR